MAFPVHGRRRNFCRTAARTHDAVCCIFLMELRCEHTLDLAQRVRLLSFQAGRGTRLQAGQNPV